jgi:hypothetical protein
MTLLNQDVSLRDFFGVKVACEGPWISFPGPSVHPMLRQQEFDYLRSARRAGAAQFGTMGILLVAASPA